MQACPTEADIDRVVTDINLTHKNYKDTDAPYNTNAGASTAMHAALIFHCYPLWPFSAPAFSVASAVRQLPPEFQLNHWMPLPTSI